MSRYGEPLADRMTALITVLDDRVRDIRAEHEVRASFQHGMTLIRSGVPSASNSWTGCVRSQTSANLAIHGVVNGAQQLLRDYYVCFTAG